MRCAHETGYPLVLLRLCLAAYRLQRAVGVEGVFAKKVVATRGITAGAGFAALELRLLLLKMMRLLQIKWSRTLVAKLDVDDLTLLVRGPTAMVVRTLGEILNWVVDYFERILKMEVSRKKSTVVASRPSIAVAIALLVDDAIVKPVSYAKLLGDDAVGGAHRSTVQLRARTAACKEKSSRFFAPRQVGAAVAKMVRAIAPPQCFTRSKQAASATPPCTQSGSRRLLLHALRLAVKTLTSLCL